MKIYSLIRRTFDIVFSVGLLILLSPIIFLSAIMIKLDSKGPVIFKQSRIGKNGIIFKIFKLRTMCDNAQSMGIGLSTAQNDPRITKVGNLLRKTSLDELPQLVNILKGQMSFIGPRPAPISHLEKYTNEDKKRLIILPGITGWAQVNGRNKLTWPERIEKDIWYVENYSLKVDIKIVLKTIKVILFSEGIYSGRNDHKINNN